MMADSDERSIWLGRSVLPHESALRAWLQRRAPPDLDVDDIIQETYTRLISIDRVDQIKDPRSYAFQVAKSVIFSHVRRGKIVSIANVPQLDHFEETETATSPERTAVYRDELVRLVRAIAGLPEPARSVFRLRRVHEKSQKEIAAELGLSEGAVERHMGHALFSLRRLFDRPAGPGLAERESMSARRSKGRRG